jgi:hypothetical protein
MDWDARLVALQELASLSQAEREQWRRDACVAVLQDQGRPSSSSAGGAQQRFLTRPAAVRPLPQSMRNRIDATSQVEVVSTGSKRAACGECLVQ